MTLGTSATSDTWHVCHLWHQACLPPVTLGMSATSDTRHVCHQWLEACPSPVTFGMSTKFSVAMSQNVWGCMCPVSQIYHHYKILCHRAKIGSAHVSQNTHVPGCYTQCPVFSSLQYNLHPTVSPLDVWGPIWMKHHKVAALLHTAPPEKTGG